jgi:hypothetical protein
LYLRTKKPKTHCRREGWREKVGGRERERREGEREAQSINVV